MQVKRTKLTAAFLAIGLAGSLLAGCGDDGDDDETLGGQNAPNAEQTSTSAPVGGSSGTDADEPAEDTPRERPPIKVVDSTPVTRSGSDGSMAANRPGASPEASPEATPAE